MTYIHPEKYAGAKISHESTCLFVDKYCLACDSFMGKCHNFDDCRTVHKTESGFIYGNLHCGEYVFGG